MLHGRAIAATAIVLCLACPGAALAAEGQGLPGATMSWVWMLPFAGILLSIATGPLLYPHLWEHHYGKFVVFWSALVLVPLALTYSPAVTTHAVVETVLNEYAPFIILLFALYTIAGGVLIAGNIHGTPLVNALLLLIGAVLASFVGTTGASMILIRPLIRANDNRPFNAHVVIFFIFLVSNIGGSLTPLGDPPLFVGFLRGVSFFWTTTHLARETAIAVGIVLAVFLALDSLLHVREGGAPKIKDPTPDSRLRLRGLPNLALLAGVVGAILLSASWHPGVVVSIAGVEVPLQNVARDVIILVLAFLSLPLTKRTYRKANGFAWGPILEVGILFAGIFVCLVPVTAILHAGPNGAAAPLVAFVTGPHGAPNNIAYFWLTGILSSFLDNAPTYLVFFELAGGDPHTLMTTLAGTLAAISAGAVFMGANTYIGNAPNFMVYAIARHQGVKMPHFFGYMLWSGAILIPTYVLIGFLFFR
jgi:Na+/H+ antiporter NhaD/arsenite permease-like protein